MQYKYYFKDVINKIIRIKLLLRYLDNFDNKITYKYYENIFIIQIKLLNICNVL